MLIVCMGLPCSGKSRAARYIKEQHNFMDFVADKIRKDLAGVSEDTPLGDEYYSMAWHNYTYSTLVSQIAGHIAWGTICHRNPNIVLDGVFRHEEFRTAISRICLEAGVPFVFMEFRCSDEKAKERMEAEDRKESDATMEVRKRIIVDLAPDEIASSHHSIVVNEGDWRDTVERIERVLEIVGFIPFHDPTNEEIERELG